MVDLLAVWGVTQAVGLIFKPILEDLAKDATKDWAKDLLKGIPGNILDKLKKEEIEIAAGKALKEFLQLMQQQLKVRCKLSEEEIKDYTKDIKKFISDNSVKEILGKAFDISGEDLNSKILEDSWKRLQLKPLPSKFNWQAFIDQYFIQVQELLQESEELRSLLELQKLSSIDNTLKEIADIPKDFNLVQYLETIRERYGNLKLDSLENTSREHPVNLWQIFIPQNVRQVYQVLPELPKEYLRRLQESNQLDAEFELEKIKEELEGYKRNYLEQPIRSVLDVIRQDKSRKNYLVILGDPGSGKSTLLQYLALDWVEQTLTHNDFNLPIPLLIELRNYVRDRDAGTCNNFLEYYHKGPNCFFHLNQHKLHEQLKAGNALVMFDGLDEIFELTKREEVITSIHRFTNEYPDVQVIVTSRIIGYKQQQLRDAEFRHFMLQDLEPAQIKQFIERWHDKTFSQAEERDKNIKRERLQRVINESKAIAELAQNPLLLTMMAILNLKRELPRDRGELYKDASEVLLHNWDEGRNLKPDERLEIIDYKDKQAMLRQVAYQMQTSEKGLAGNIIHGDDLEAIFTKYLQSIPVNDARDKARRLMKQLRDRNFILCFLGANHYAFVHRTFLEFFCASEFVRQFEKERSITIEYLKTEVFGKHWQDETWHEVLRLIAGMIDAKFVGEIIDYLMVQDGEEEKFINLFLAANCLAEVRNRLVIESTANKLLDQLKDLTQYDLWYYYEPYNSEEEFELVQKIRTQAVATIVTIWQDNPGTLDWLKDRATADYYEDVQFTAIEVLASNFKDDPDTRSFLKDCATADYDWNVRFTAIEALASNFKDNPDTRSFLKDLATAANHSYVRRVAIQPLASNFKDDPDTHSILKDLVTADYDEIVRRAAIEALASNFKDDPDTHSILKDLITADNRDIVRFIAIQALASNFKDDPDTHSILKNLASADNHEDVRRAAIEALVSNFKDDPDIRSILKARATADNHEDVRRVAIEALASNFKDDPDTHWILKDRATAGNDENVRFTAIEALAKNFKDDPDTHSILKDRATADNHWNVRRAVIQALASNFKDDPDTHWILKDRATTDNRDIVRRAAIQALASNFKDDPETYSILKDRANTDNHWNVRDAAIKALASNFKDDPDTHSILKNLASADNHEDVRRAAIEALVSNFKDDPDTHSILKNLASADNHEDVRRAAIEALASNFKDDPDTHSILKNLASADNHEMVRRAAIQALAKHFRNQPDLFEIYYDCTVNDSFEGSHKSLFNPNPRRVALEIIIKQFPQHPQTLPLLHDKAENDQDEKVREFAQKKLKQWKV